MSCSKGKAGWFHFILVLMFTMALKVSKVSSSAFVTQRTSTSRINSTIFSYAKSLPQSKLHPINQGFELQLSSNAHPLAAKFSSGENLRGIHGQPVSFIVSRRSSTVCLSTRTPGTEEKECLRPYGDFSDMSRSDCLNIHCCSWFLIYQPSQISCQFYG